MCSGEGSFLVETDVRDIAEVDATWAGGVGADVEAGVVCDHLGEDV